MTVTFAPTAASTYGGSVAVTSDATSGVNTIAASGTGTQPVQRIIALSGNLAFGSVAIGNSAQATLTIANTGNAALTVSSISYPSGFSGNWSGGTIGASSVQPVTVTFAPTAATTYGGSVAVTSDATSGANTIAASGIGSADTTPPVIAIISPTNGQVFTFSPVTINGVATDNVAVAIVAWALDQGGGGGMAVGTTNWTVSGLSLRPGTNVITIIAFDGAGNSTSTNVIVTFMQTQPVPITNPQLAGRVFSGTVQTVVGMNYVLEFKTSLSDADWSVAQTLTGNGGPITLTDNAAATPTRFYRVHVQ